MTCRSVCLVLFASASLCSGALPDLIIWGPVMNPKIVTRTYGSSDCSVVEGCIVAGTRRLLIFDTESRNIGEGDLYLGSPVNNPLFQYAACHNHYHFRGFADYRLIDPARNEVATGLKVGFCLLDSRRWDPTVPNSSRYDCLDQGIQAGWGDVYGSSLPCQWIDITSLAAGTYTLEVEVDPDNRLAESNDTNNITRVLVVIDGVCTTAPPNDAFASAQTVQGRVVTVIGSNSCATRQTSEPAHADNTAAKSIWYRWVPDYTGQATITTLGSTLDTVLAVYRGATLTALTAVASNDDTDTASRIYWSSVTFPVTNGVPQLIAVDGFSGAAGGVALNINPAGNDRFTNCLQIAGLNGNSTSVNAGATNEPGEPPHGAHSVWYCWTATSNAVMRFHTHGSSVDTRLTLYQGTGLTNLTPVASNDDAAGRQSSAVLFNAIAGTTYLVAVASTDEGLVSLTWEPAVVPHFASITRNADVYELLLAGRANDRYRIEYSPDLRTWQTLGAATNVAGMAGYDGTNSGLSGFYRATLLP
jgi:lysyl oxidase